MKYLITIFLTFFIAQAEQKIEIFDAQGNKIKEVIRNGERKENIIEPHELKAHNQEIKIKELEKENKILKNQIKELKDKIAKLNSDIKFKDMQISIKEIAEKNNKMMNTSLTFMTIAQYLFFAVVILSIIGWIISLFTKKARNDEI
nr:hypothetical protein [uncultured Campylobacter sp.]